MYFFHFCDFLFDLKGKRINYHLPLPLSCFDKLVMLHAPFWSIPYRIFCSHNEKSLGKAYELYHTQLLYDVSFSNPSKARQQICSSLLFWDKIHCVSTVLFCGNKSRKSHYLPLSPWRMLHRTKERLLCEFSNLKRDKEKVRSDSVKKLPFTGVLWDVIEPMYHLEVLMTVESAWKHQRNKAEKSSNQSDSCELGCCFFKNSSFPFFLPFHSVFICLLFFLSSKWGKSIRLVPSTQKRKKCCAKQEGKIKAQEIKRREFFLFWLLIFRINCLFLWRLWDFKNQEIQIIGNFTTTKGWNCNHAGMRWWLQPNGSTSMFIMRKYSPFQAGNLTRHC